jgi:hypothetical protein
LYRFGAAAPGLDGKSCTGGAQNGRQLIVTTAHIDCAAAQPQCYGIIATGNGLFYAITPTLDVALVGTVVKTYDGKTGATLTASNYAYAGALDGDLGVFTATSTASYTNLITLKSCQ